MGRKNKPDRRGKKRDRDRRSKKRQIVPSRQEQYAKQRHLQRGLTQEEVEEKRKAEVMTAEARRRARDGI